MFLSELCPCSLRDPQLFCSQTGTGNVTIMSDDCLHLWSVWINQDMCLQTVGLRERCIKNVGRNTNIVSETTTGLCVTVQTHRLHLFTTLIRDDETFNKAAARLYNRYEHTHRHTLTHTDTHKQMMKVSFAHSNVTYQTSLCETLQLKGWKCLTLCDCSPFCSFAHVTLSDCGIRTKVSSDKNTCNKGTCQCGGSDQDVRECKNTEWVLIGRRWSPAGRSLAGRSPVGRSPAGRSPAGRSPAGRSPAGWSPAGRRPVVSWLPVFTGSITTSHFDLFFL